MVSSQIEQSLITVSIVAYEITCACCDPGAHSRWIDVSWSREHMTSLLWGMQQLLNRQAASACLLQTFQNMLPKPALCLGHDVDCPCFWL